MCMFKRKMEKLKFWLEPAVEVAQSIGLSPREINEARRIVQEHENDIRSAWHTHFPR